MEELKHQLEEIVKMCRLRLKDPYFQKLYDEYNKVLKELRGYELFEPEIGGLLDSLKKSSEFARKLVGYVVEYIIESDMVIGPMTVPEIITLLDFVLYAIELEEVKNREKEITSTS